MPGLGMPASIGMASRLLTGNERAEALPDSAWIDALPQNDGATVAFIRRGDSLG